MFLAQISYGIPTDDLKMTFHACFKARLTEATEEAAVAAFHEFIKTCPYKTKDQAVYKSFFVEKKLK